MVLITLSLFCVTVSKAAETPAKPTVRGSRTELRDVRARIEVLQNTIEQAEASQDDAREALENAQQQVANSQARLREIAQERQEIEAELRMLVQERKRREAQLAVAREKLGQTLYQLYVDGGQAGTRRLLGGQDANQLSRDAWYLQQIAKSRAGTIETARAAVASLQTTEIEVLERQAELLALENTQKRSVQNLHAASRHKQEVLKSTDRKILLQRQEIQVLQRNQARMENLLAGLERIETQKRAATPSNATATSSAKPAPKKGSARVKTPEREVESIQVPEKNSAISGSSSVASESAVPPLAENSGFVQQQGHLPWPVKGRVSAQFGTTRGEASAGERATTWRGWFIQAAAGDTVRAVAAGRVTYADWLRGFGNLLIVDHGDGYMSIYANNETLSKAVGQRVQRGEVLANVGASGAETENGVYFEIRYRGQAQNPAKWLAQRP